MSFQFNKEIYEKLNRNPAILKRNTTINYNHIDNEASKIKIKMNFFLLGILMGTFPTLQSPVIPLNKKMVPAFFSFLVMALLDWSDGSIILFLGMAVMTNWVYQSDILNLVVDKMMQMMIEAKNKITDVVQDMVPVPLVNVQNLG